MWTRIKPNTAPKLHHFWSHRTMAMIKLCVQLLIIQTFMSTLEIQKPKCLPSLWLCRPVRNSTLKNLPNHPLEFQNFIGQEGVTEILLQQKNINVNLATSEG